MQVKMVMNRGSSPQNRGFALPALIGIIGFKKTRLKKCGIRKTLEIQPRNHDADEHDPTEGITVLFESRVRVESHEQREELFLEGLQHVENAFGSRRELAGRCGK
jgi:hypothetical protein